MFQNASDLSGATTMVAVRQTSVSAKGSRIGERIGGGSMADVYAAVDRRKVEAGVADPGLAVKVISKAFSRHARALETLQREALSGQSLTHPNIVRIFDCVT